MEGLLDPQVLKVAADAGRLLVSHDKRTLPRHFAEFIVNQMSPGVVVVPQALPTAAAVEELLLIWHASEPEEWLNRIAHHHRALRQRQPSQRGAERSERCEA